MLRFQFMPRDEKINLPKYSLSQGKRLPISKSTFVDSNRADTVQPAIIGLEKPYSLSQGESLPISKSTFVDSNRVDTVQPAIIDLGKRKSLIRK